MEDFSYYDLTAYGQVASSSETSLCYCLSSDCYIPADIYLCSYCYENLTPYKTYFIHHEEEAMFVVVVCGAGGGGVDDDSEKEEKWGSCF